MTARRLLLVALPLLALAAGLFLLLGGQDDAREASTPGAVVGIDDVVSEDGTTTLAPGVAGDDIVAIDLPVPSPDGSAAPHVAVAEPPGRVSGVLVDALGRPVAGEPVLLALLDDHWSPVPRRIDEAREDAWELVSSTVSAEDGRFALPALLLASQQLVAGGKAWARTKVLPVMHGDVLRVVLPEGRVLEGVVLEEGTRAPVPHAHVLAGTKGINLVGTADEDGRFRLGPVPPEDVLAAAWAPGYAIELAAPLSPGSKPVELLLGPGIPVVGRAVERGTLKPVPSGTVTLVLDVEAFPPETANLLQGTLLVHEESATLGPDGSFSFPASPAFGFWLRVEAPGYVPHEYRRYEDRSLDEDDQIALFLQPVVPIAGRVLEAESGSAAAGVEVQLQVDGASARPRTLVTSAADALGRFELPIDAWDGQGGLSVLAGDAARGFGRADAQPQLKGPPDLDRPPQDVVVQLVAPLQIEVRVLSSGQPLPGADVAAHSAGGPPSLATSGEAGLVTLIHPLADPGVDTVTLLARHELFFSVPLEVPVSDLLYRTQPVELDVQGGVFVEGGVSDPFGAPIASALLKVDKGPSAHSDERGRFRLGPLEKEESVDVTVSAEDHREQRLAILGVPGELAIVLQPSVSWTGRVLDARTGEGLAGWLGVLQVERLEDDEAGWKDDGWLSVRSGNPSEFSVELPQPGRFRVRVHLADHLPGFSVEADFDGAVAPVPVDVALEQAAVLEVVVQDGLGRPVPGYEVVAIPWETAQNLKSPSGDPRKGAPNTRTDEAGLARLQLGEGGSYRIGAGPKLWLDEARVYVEPGMVVRRLYTLPPTGELAIQVTDPLGNAVPGSTVQLRSAKGSDEHAVSRKTMVRQADGVVVLGTLPPGNYNVRVRHRHFGQWEGETLVVGNALEHLDVRLPGPQPAPQAQGGQVIAPQQGKGPR